MSGSHDDRLWRDPAHAVSGLLHAVSKSLGGDLVLWARVDNDSGTVTVVDVVESIESATSMADRLRGRVAVTPTSLGAQVARSGRSLLVPQFDVSDFPVDTFPAPWPEYYAAHPVHGLVAVPVLLDEAVTGVLFVARRTTATAYTPDDLLFVESCAQRLAAVTDVTHDIVFRRQVERLLRLSESLTTALDEQRVADCVCSFLVDTFQGRSTVALRDDDALVIVALAGFSDEDAARWTGARVELLEDSPIAEAARTNTLVVLTSPADFDLRYPILDAPRSAVRDEASLSMPLRADPAGLAVGVMHVGWDAPRSITDAMTTLAGTVSSLVTLALGRIAASQKANEVEFRHALDAMLDDVAIGHAVRSNEGEIVDFVIDFVNSHGADGAPRDADALVGRLMCEIYPEWRTSGMFDRFRDVVETGIPYQGDRLPTIDTTATGQPLLGHWSLQVAKFGDGYIAASRDVTEIVAAEEAMQATAMQAAAERTAIVLLQAAALPATLPAVSGVRFAAVYEPADPRQPVGGDWYDIFALDADRVAVLIADVAGHGHRAAVFMLQVRNIFRAIAAEYTDPGDVLVRANDVTTRLNEPDGPFVTCCFAVLDIVARTLRWAQAGHFSPLVVLADGTSKYLAEHPGPPLALFEGHRYESSAIDVRPGDRVLMFTDGLVERRREHLDIGLARLEALASSHAALAPQPFVETLAASVTDRFDDLALVCIDLVDATG